MPKVIKSTGPYMHNVRKFIWEFPDLKYDGSQIICLVCNRSLWAYKKYLCLRHVNSATHKLNKNGQRPYTQFIFDLITMLCSCNMPLYVLNKEPFRHFWTKYNPTWNLPSRSTLQRHLPFVREKLEDNIKSQIQYKNLWLAVDEITDSKKHSVANVIVRPLDPLHSSSAYLLASKRLEKCTSEALHHLILTTLQKYQLSTHQVLLFLSDDTALMHATGRALKTVCPNLLHITCLLHALQLTARKVQEYYPEVDALITSTKAVLQKSPKRIRAFRKQCSGIPEPPQPILTQGGAWLEAAFYYLQHFNKLKYLVLQFDAKESVVIRESKLKFQDAQVLTDLQTLHTNYSILVDAINKLQNTSLSLVETLQIIDDVQKVLHTLSDEKGICVKEKFDSIIRKNPDFARVRHIFSNGSDMDPLHTFRDYFNYANMTSVDVERSFSLYKDIFSPQRTSLMETTLETYAMLQVFRRGNPDF